MDHYAGRQRHHHVRSASLAQRAEVPLVKIDWTGRAITVVSGDSFAANRDRVAWQTETRSDRRKRMTFCNALIARKIEGCVQTLEASLRQSHAWDRAMRRAKDDLARLANDPPETVNELRLLEARSAVAYFRAWYATSLLWRTSARHPIPDEWRTVGPRFTRVYGSGSRNASHPVNAILNYAYAVLQSQVQIRFEYLHHAICLEYLRLIASVRPSLTALHLANSSKFFTSYPNHSKPTPWTEGEQGRSL
jgi:CRISPR/Cas system-associated endonuclease Cas1